MLGLALLALALLPGALSQAVSDVVCNVTSLSWMFNSVGDSPCQVTAELAGACNGGAFSLGPLPAGFVYLGPTTLNANPCRCNTVYYSMLSACGACQGDGWISWNAYKVNCSTVYASIFPQALPAGTVVPGWAYANLAATNNFSIALAESLENSPESSAIPSSTFAISTTALPFPSDGPSSTLSPISGPPNSDSGSGSNAGAIAGGVVGGVAGLALVAGLAFFFLRRRKAASQGSASDSAFNTMPYSPAPHNSDLSPNMSYVPEAAAAYPSQQSMQSQRLYDPSDPSTFPTTPYPLPDMPYTSAHTPPDAPGGYNPFQGSTEPYMPSPDPAGHYTGAPEL